MKSHRLVTRIALVLAITCLGVNAFATSFVMPSDRELIAKADAIVTGTVVSSRVARSEAGLIETVVEVEVSRQLKGRVAGHVVTVFSPGGELDGRFLLVESAARFAVGEEVLLFLTAEGRRWTPTDMVLGKFVRTLTTKGYNVLVRDNEDIDGRAADGRPRVDRVRLEADFLRFVEGAAHGLTQDVDYEVAAAEAFAPGPAAAPRRSMANRDSFPASTYSTRFVACEGTLPARWPELSTESGVYWFRNVSNDLASAEDRGAGLIRTGMNAWVSDGGSAIRMAYAGTTSELAADDSTNVIVFSDPQHLIPGSWTGSGVIATSFLYGAGTHTFKGETYLNITGADIVFQDGYSAAEHSLEAAMTHELGHTAGLRHANEHFDVSRAAEERCASSSRRRSCEPFEEECSTSALMNAIVIDASGSILQPWDIHAANALYPVANAIPAPPTNVQAVSSSSAGVFVSWSGSDGATSYSVWRSDGGPYVYIGDPAPPAATSFLDSGAAAGSAYIYAVTANNASGSSDFSGPDIAVNIVFTDSPLPPGSQIKAVHLTELRTAATALYGLAHPGTTFDFVDPTIVVGSTTIKAIHFEEVESVLRAARLDLGLSVPAPLGIASGVVVPASHVTALRSYAQ
jgi:hypothetical protein